MRSGLTAARPLCRSLWGAAAARHLRLPALVRRSRLTVVVKLRITIIATAMARARRTEQETEASAAPAEYRGLALPSRARLTPQRAALLDLIAERPGSFTAVELFEEARRRRPRLGLATVYRAVALFDLVPEALEAIGDDRRVTTLVGGGFLLFFVAERFLVLHHRDDPAQARAHGDVGALGAAALAFH